MTMVCHVCGEVKQVLEEFVTKGETTDGINFIRVECCSQICVDRYIAENGIKNQTNLNVIRERSKLEVINQNQTKDDPAKNEYIQKLALIWKGEKRQINDELYAPPKRYYKADWCFINKIQAPGFITIAKRFLNGEIRQLIITGLEGRGKTTAAYSLMNGFLKHNFGKCWHSAAFVHWAELSIVARQCFSNYGPTADKAEQTMSEYAKVGMLVIDEFCLTEPGKDELIQIHNLLYKRYGAKWWTVLITPRDLTDVMKLMDGGIASRFSGEADNGCAITFPGPDLRQKRDSTTNPLRRLTNLPDLTEMT